MARTASPRRIALASGTKSGTSASSTPIPKRLADAGALHDRRAAIGRQPDALDAAEFQQRRQGGPRAAIGGDMLEALGPLRPEAVAARRAGGRFGPRAKRFRSRAGSRKTRRSGGPGSEMPAVAFNARSDPSFHDAAGAALTRC